MGTRKKNRLGPRDFGDRKCVLWCERARTSGADGVKNSLWPWVPMVSPLGLFDTPYALVYKIKLLFASNFAHQLTNRK